VAKHLLMYAGIYEYVLTILYNVTVYNKSVKKCKFVMWCKRIYYARLFKCVK